MKRLGVMLARYFGPAKPIYLKVVQGRGPLAVSLYHAGHTQLAAQAYA